MIISAHQPAYLPWLGYFDKIIRSDIFIFLDSVQYEKNSFINRNRIKTPNGPIWLTIPVITKGHTSETLMQTKIDNKQNWKRKHLNSIYQNYKKAKRFEELFPKIEKLYKKEFEVLADLCFVHLLFWLDELKISKKIIRSSTLSISARKSDLILELCKQFKADHYISGIHGKDYLDTKKFLDEGITVEFQEYKHPIYPQLYGEFLPFMGIVDFCMNTDETNLITKGG